MGTAVGLATLAGLLLVAIVHIDDRYAIDHNPGSWMAQGQSAEHGVLITPLEDHGYLGGTRYGPPIVLLLAGLGRLTGDLLLSWKLIALAAAVALLVAGGVLCRRLGAPWWLVAAGGGLLMGAGAVETAAVRSGADVAPLAIGVCVLLVLRRPGRRPLVLAGVLAAAAVLVKISVVWPLLVGTIWAVRRRGRVGWVVPAAGIATIATGSALAELASQGRWWQSLQAVGVGSMGPGDLLTALHRFSTGLLLRQGALGPLVAVATVIALRGLVRRRPTLVQSGLLVAIATIWPLYADIGMDTNHLVDILVLSVIVLVEAAVAARLDVRPARWAAGATAFATLLLAAAVAQATLLAPTVRHAVREAAGAPRPPAEQPDPFGSLVPKGATLLSEDPTFPILRGQRPVIADPFMARRLLDSHPAWRRALIARVRDHAFDRVIMYARGVHPPGWYRLVHLGLPLAEAIWTAYTPVARVGEYVVYRPRTDG